MPGLIDLVDTAVQEASDLDDAALRAEVEAAAGPARDAVNGFAAWLRDELQPRAPATSGSAPSSTRRSSATRSRRT